MQFLHMKGEFDKFIIQPEQIRKKFEKLKSRGEEIFFSWAKSIHRESVKKITACDIFLTA